jgi:hypothetical protein
MHAYDLTPPDGPQWSRHTQPATIGVSLGPRMPIVSCAYSGRAMYQRALRGGDVDGRRGILCGLSMRTFRLR